MLPEPRNPTSMNNVIIKLYQPELEVISDRTFRFILKKLSTIARNIQKYELLNIIDSCNLDDDKKNVFLEYLNPKLEHMEGFYLVKIERGSLNILTNMTEVAKKLLITSAEEKIKESEILLMLYKSLQDRLSNGNGIFLEKKDVIENIVRETSFDRFEIENVEIVPNEDKDIIITIILITNKEVDSSINKEKISYEYVFSLLNKKMSRLVKTEKRNVENKEKKKKGKKTKGKKTKKKKHKKKKQSDF